MQCGFIGSLIAIKLRPIKRWCEVTEYFFLRFEVWHTQHYTILTAVIAARSYVGVPFYHAGRDRNGIDCIGLIACVAKDLGYAFKDNRNYSPKGSYPELMADGISQFCTKREGLDYSVGDVLLFKVKRLYHMGIVTGDNLMVHCAFTHPGVTVETSIGRYGKFIDSVWEWK